MSTLALLVATLLCISICSVIVIRILESKVDIGLINFVSNIIMLPAVPLFWLISREFGSDGNKFITFYIPLIMTILVIGMLVFKVGKYIKDNSEKM